MVHPLDVVMKAHNKDYVRWLKDRLSRGSMDDIAMWLAQKPSPTILRYQAYDINGYMFYTEERDKKTSYQNSSIRIECITIDEADKRVYYGTIEEIWELNYVKVKVPLFRCKWVPLSQVKVDEYRKTYVNKTKMAYHKDPFILASDATQIFYVEDPLHKNCHVVMRGKRRVLGVEGVADEDEYDEFAEMPVKGSCTKHKERFKIIRNPKFIRGQPNDPSSPMYMGINT